MAFSKLTVYFYVYHISCENAPAENCTIEFVNIQHAK